MDAKTKMPIPVENESGQSVAAAINAGMKSVSRIVSCFNAAHAKSAEISADAATKQIRDECPSSSKSA
jgi:hypothetical protein